MPRAVSKYTDWGLYALIAVLALAQTGCLLAIAGVCSGAAATGYFYCKGRIYRDYPAPFSAVHDAVHAALLDLHFAINEEAKDGKAFFVTKTTNGKKVRIYLECLSSPIPAEGQFTRVSIRVGAFGDDSVSARIFEQTALRLSHPVIVAPAPPGPPPIPVPQPIQQTGFQTTEPAIAPTK
ncbi:MAG: DUF3568 family protein [Gemmataceae bacterium]